MYLKFCSALDLLERLLAFDPILRIDVETALNHPYFELFHDPEDEVLYIRVLQKFCADIRVFFSLHIQARLISLLNH